MKKLICLLLCVFLPVFSACAGGTAAEMKITVFAAGKADAILITTEAGSVLIDTGLEENRDRLLADLSARGVTHLDALIITHFDKDHVGGADAVLETLSVSHVYTTWQSKSSDDITSYEQALSAAGLAANVIRGTQTFTLGSALFTLYGASDSYEKDESNNSSLIIRVTFGTKTYLFMGDAEEERIAEFLSYDQTDADFLKVPYHGHSQDCLEELLAAVSPAVSVITDSPDEPDAEEIRKTVRLLEESGSAVYRTAEGTVEITCAPDAFTVSQ